MNQRLSTENVECQNDLKWEKSIHVHVYVDKYAYMYMHVHVHVHADQRDLLKGEKKWPHISSIIFNNIYAYLQIS